MPDPSLEQRSFSIIRLNPFEDLDRVRAIWHSLQSEVQHSYFLSWGWIAAWLTTVDGRRRVEFIAVEDDGQIVGAFFLGHCRGLRRGFIYRRGAFLNATGKPDLDEVTIEYNGALELPGTHAFNCVFHHREFRQVEEFVLPAITQSAYLALRVPMSEYSVESHREAPSYLVDLAAIRSAGNDYLDWLSRNRRSQLRRSLAAYSDGGQLQTIEASSAEQAMSMLFELRQLHERRWSKRGRPGAFASEPFVRFHQTLIESRFDAGEIQMLHIRNARETLGYLYNFVYDKQVLYYQSGFNYGSSNLKRPGLVSHHQAIIHNLAKGHDSYNFLAGESAYKKSLSTRQDDTLVSLRIVRRGWKLQLETWARRLRDGLRRH